jgi:hypothetical protein
MNKIIQKNPELFQINSSGTRKKSSKPKEIKIKNPKEHNNTVAKRNSLLKFIRRHQENKLKSESTESIKPELSGDFDESMKYLMDMTEQLERKGDSNSKYTLKNHEFHDHENVSMNFPDVTEPIFNPTPRPPLPAPSYGCLKYGGSLPTFRQYHGNQTKKNLPSNLDYLEKIDSEKNNLETNDLEKNNLFKTDIIGGENKNHSLSQRKILRRTFKIGKSNANNKISVLVSNRTIRNRISNKNIELKQTPMLEVRRYLVKHGLIKIGSPSPPDVLRQMYESASLMCGNITNHNSETLMYNYLNSEKKSW